MNNIHIYNKIVWNQLKSCCQPCSVTWNGVPRIHNYFQVWQILYIFVFHHEKKFSCPSILWWFINCIILIVKKCNLFSHTADNQLAEMPFCAFHTDNYIIKYQYCSWLPKSWPFWIWRGNKGNSNGMEVSTHINYYQQINMSIRACEKFHLEVMVMRMLLPLFILKGIFVVYWISFFVVDLKWQKMSTFLFFWRHFHRETSLFPLRPPSVFNLAYNNWISNV